MWRKALWSMVVALFSLSLCVIGVVAQEGSAPGDLESSAMTPAVTVQPNAAAANVVQTVPITLTLSIPSPTGTITVEVPVFLSLNIHIGISPELTTTLEVTPSIATGEEVTSTVTSRVTPESTARSTPRSTTAAPTVIPSATPTATPLALEPTATAAPAEAETEATSVVPLPTATPTATAASEVLAPICPDPRAVIVAPGVGQRVSGTVNILGTATHENFQYYKVEYAEGENVDPNSDFSYLADARVQITGGLLATFDSTNVANGPYTFKLTVVDASGNFPPPCTVSVVVEN